MTDEDSSQKDARKMAEQFLSLWEKQLEATLRDPDMVQHTLKTMQNAQQQFFTQGMKQDGASEFTADDELPTDGDDELSELDRRLRAMEERISNLEAAFIKGSAGA